ncbi:MAG: hypothetical protein Q4A32_09500 [Lachnospiraceae bacterium]|nr:hypothetical protein [Lachnospiraceae bacterium]
MKKKTTILAVLVATVSMAFAACGNSKPVASQVKNTATATMDEGEMPIEVTIDVSTGYSVVFDHDGFLLFDGEYDDSTYPLVTATILTEDVYNMYIENNKDSDSFQEDYGIMKYTSSIGELTYLYKVGEKVPFMMSFEEGVDEKKADEITGCMEFDYE